MAAPAVLRRHKPVNLEILQRRYHLRCIFDY
jgi:hypothetical protein